MSIFPGVKYCETEPDAHSSGHLVIPLVRPQPVAVSFSRDLRVRSWTSSAVSRDVRQYLGFFCGSLRYGIPDVADEDGIAVLY